MIAVIKPNASDEQIAALIAWLERQAVRVHRCPGNGGQILGIIGDTERIDTELLRSMQIVESVCRVSDPYKQANRKFHPCDSVVRVGNASFGGGHFALIAGPCSVESAEQLFTIAEAVKRAGADVLRGGAFKPRTSPYAFQGLGKEALLLLSEAKRQTGLPIVTEIMNISQLELFSDVDIVQVGARNMQNFDLLRELGRSDKPVLLKRGLASTLREMLMSAEYIMNEGNEQIVLCERGIRTFETQLRNTLDLSAVPMLHEMTHLPVIVDPSHATGMARIVPPMALAATACGADGIMVEVHHDPKCALCDGAQSLTPSEFAALSQKITKIRQIIA